MGRFHFQDDGGGDDDDENDTDYGSPPKKGGWDRSHFQQSHAAEDSSTTEQEEGEIIEDESETEDGGDWNNDNRSEGERRSFRSYFPSFSDPRARNYFNSRSPSSGRSFDEEPSPQNWDETDDHSGCENNNNNNNNENLDGREEYRLIGSSKYDRNYDQNDFYSEGIEGNNSYDHSNNSNSYTNAVSDDDDDDDHKFRRNSDGALVRSSTHQNPSSGAHEIHYHIYVSEKQASRWFPPNEDEPLRLSDEGSSDAKNDKRNTVSWKLITRWAVLTHFLMFLVLRYNLIELSPPPSYLTWEEYGSHQFRLIRRISREGYSLLKHLTKATAEVITKRDSLSNDDVDAAIVSPRFNFPQTWASFEPFGGLSNVNFRAGFEGGSAVHQYQETVLFGQDAALEHLRNGLDNWSTSQRMHRETRRSMSHAKERSSTWFQQQQRPLIVYAFGGRGVGKNSLAYLLLEQLEQHDTSDRASVLEECAAAVASTNSSPLADTPFDPNWSSESENREFHCPLMHLTSLDLSSEQFRSHQYRDDDGFYRNDVLDDLTIEKLESSEHFEKGSIMSTLYQNIQDHVLAAGEGASIVVLDKIDTVVTCDYKTEICHKDSSLPTSWLRDLMIEILSQAAIFGNTIFVLTSQTGKETVEKWTRKRLHSLQGAGDSTTISAAANSDVEALVRYELQRYYTPTNGSEEDVVSDSSMGIQNWLLIPMAPLEKNSMAAILGKIASRGPNLAFLDGISVQRKFLEEPWRKRLMHLTDSASDRILDALEWHQWIHRSSGEVLRIWSPDGAFPLLELWGKRVLERIDGLSDCPVIGHEGNETTMMVLDYEGVSTDRLWLRSCEMASKDDSSVLTTSTDGRSWICSGVASSCLFYL